MIKVKICGMTTQGDIEMCSGAGADALGFVTEYPQDVPWNLSAERAARLIQHVPNGVVKFMVAGGLPEEIVSLAKRTRPDVVQLHGGETTAETAETAEQLRALGIRAAKALRTDEDGNLLFEHKNILEAVEALEKTGVAAILLDSATRDRPGGTGRAVNVETYKALMRATTLPIILAGGLRAENLAGVLSAGTPYMLDVLTGVEKSPGVKDIKKTAAFIRAAKTIQKEMRA